METSIFRLDSGKPKLSSTTNDFVFEIPLIAAYAVEFATVTINGISETCSMEISGSDISLSPGHSIEADDEVLLFIHHHGIRDYSLLFPHVAPQDLADRLGAFYEEAEKSFRTGSWLSFTLVCGAVFEGMLFAKYRKSDKFKELIDHALSQGDIDSSTEAIMHRVRDFRNLVHARRYAQAYVTRKDAMDIRTTLDKLIKAFPY